MKPLVKSLSILAISGIFAGAALGGPGDAYAGYPAASFAKARAESKTEHVTIALFRPGVTLVGAKDKAEKTLIPSGNPKMPGVVQRATGSR